MTEREKFERWWAERGSQMSDLRRHEVAKQAWDASRERLVLDYFTIMTAQAIERFAKAQDSPVPSDWLK